MGHSLGWLPDGRLLVTGDRLRGRHEADGSIAVHADLDAISPYGWSEMTIDGKEVGAGWP